MFLRQDSSAAQLRRFVGDRRPMKRGGQEWLIAEAARRLLLPPLQDILPDLDEEPLGLRLTYATACVIIAGLLVQRFPGGAWAQIVSDAIQALGVRAGLDESELTKGASNMIAELTVAEPAAYKDVCRQFDGAVELAADVLVGCRLGHGQLGDHVGGALGELALVQPGPHAQRLDGVRDDLGPGPAREALHQQARDDHAGGGVGEPKPQRLFVEVGEDVLQGRQEQTARGLGDQPFLAATLHRAPVADEPAQLRRRGVLSQKHVRTRLIRTRLPG